LTNQVDIRDHANYKPLLDHGFVGIADEELNDGTLVPAIMGNDRSITRSARMSYGKGTKAINDDTSLIRYLLRHHHTTPFEMAEIKFHAKMPIFVARQWVRHRTASINEYSARYSILTNEFYIPNVDNLQPQSTNNKQGRDGLLTDYRVDEVQKTLQASQQAAYDVYEALLDEDGDEGVAREIARTVLPTSGYTEWYWKANLHNVLNFIRLRVDPHAQYEIRVYADAMLELMRPYFPIALEAFDDYVVHAEQFSKMEMTLIREMFNHTRWDSYYPGELSKEKMRKQLNMSKREWSEFEDKFGLAKK